MSEPIADDALIDELLLRPESKIFDCKRLGKLDKILETVVAFANTLGGIIALGLEGVPMMFGTMKEAGLYPPHYTTRPRLPRKAVCVYLWNQNRPSIWEQVSDHIDKHGEIGNAEIRKLMQSEDTLRASKMLKTWVEQGLLEVANPDAGRNVRRYRRPTADFSDLFSNLDGKERSESP